MTTTTYSEGDRWPACDGSTLLRDPPYRCLNCGWSSEPKLLVNAPPLAPHYIAEQHGFEPAISPPSWRKAITDRLRTAGYLGYGQQATLVQHWKKQYDVVADQTHFTFLLYDATTIWLSQLTLASEHDTVAELIEATNDRSPDRPGDHEKNVVNAHTWLQKIGAPRILASQQTTLGSNSTTADWSESDLGRCVAIDGGERCPYSQIHAPPDLCWTHCYLDRNDDYTLTRVDDQPAHAAHS
jgi:hypothetical protein